jgi:hypothetical protein
LTALTISSLESIPEESNSNGEDSFGKLGTNPARLVIRRVFNGQGPTVLPYRLTAHKRLCNGWIVVEWCFLCTEWSRYWVDEMKLKNSGIEGAKSGVEEMGNDHRVGNRGE